MSADVELRIVLVEIATVLSKQDVEVLAFIYGLENCQDAMKLMGSTNQAATDNKFHKKTSSFYKGTHKHWQSGLSRECGEATSTEMQRKTTFSGIFSH